MSWNCLIVDDEAIARKLIAEYVQKIPELKLIATCSSPLKAMEYIRSGQIDIIFLDIQMPDITGLDFLKSIPPEISTILITAYSEYAAQSYDLNVTDYVLKPIEFDRFYMAVSKATGALNQKVANLETPSSPVSDKLFIKADNQIIKLAYDSIITINGQGAYVQIYTTDGRKIMSLQSMSKLEAALPSNFFRTHRSHLVNIDQIDAIDGNMIILGEHKVTLSKNKRKEFFKLIDKANLLGSD